MVKPMSVQQVSEEFGIPLSSAYRYVDILRKTGLITVKCSVVRETGAKYNLYESVLKGVSISFEGGSFEVDIVLKEDMVSRFMRFWRSFGEE